MKVIKYNLCTRVNYGTEESPQWENILSSVEMTWNVANEEIAKLEAHNGEYSIVDDGQEELEPALSVEERTAALEEALSLLLEGATE